MALIKVPSQSAQPKQLWLFIDLHGMSAVHILECGASCDLTNSSSTVSLPNTSLRDQLQADSSLPLTALSFGHSAITTSDDSSSAWADPASLREATSPEASTLSTFEAENEEAATKSFKGTESVRESSNGGSASGLDDTSLLFELTETNELNHVF